MIRNMRHDRDQLGIQPAACWAIQFKNAWPYRNINAHLAYDKYGKSV
jgi:hypothetical protein